MFDDDYEWWLMAVVTMIAVLMMDSDDHRWRLMDDERETEGDLKIS